MALLRAAPGLKSGEHLDNDGRDISSIVNASVVGTLPNQPHPLYSLLEPFRLIVVQTFLPLPCVEVL